jgi:hypothetical protein
MYISSLDVDDRSRSISSLAVDITSLSLENYQRGWNDGTLCKYNSLFPCLRFQCFSVLCFECVWIQQYKYGRDCTRVGIACAPLCGKKWKYVSNKEKE